MPVEAGSLSAALLRGVLMARVPYLTDLQEEIEAHASVFGLSYFETIFEVLDYKRMTEVAAYGGFPVRYPHWRFGMEYDRLLKSHTYGLSHIYELVINNDPCYAYLLEGNNLTIQKLVICHVLAHCDFFKNNIYFEVTNRKMIDEMANHATRLRRYMERHGVDAVEAFVDVCLSLENLIDVHSPYIRRHPGPKPPHDEDPPAEGPDEGVRLKARSYMDPYINPPAVLQAERERLKEKKSRARIPAQPERDVLAFLLEHAPLNRWQRNVLEIVRDEAYYFAPQKMTKIINEGWATYWHSRLMTEKVLSDPEVIDYAEVTSAVTAAGPGQLNPYRLGVMLLRNIEERWDRGQFGKDWVECDDMAAKANWNRRLGLGHEKLMEVRRFYNDVTLLDEFLTPDFCREQKLFNFGFNERRSRWEIETRKFEEIKQRLLFSLTNFGQPFIFAEDGNYRNRGDLLLRHRHEGIDLKMDEAQATLENIHKIWGRPVHLVTASQGKEMTLSYDGSSHDEKAGT
jgi:stage V sporulation protein R